MHRIVMIGCGVVGQGFLKILQKKSEYLWDNYGLDAEVVAISDKMKGSIIVPEGIDIPALLAHIEAGKSIDDFLAEDKVCLLYTSPSPRDRTRYRMPSSA